MGVMWCVGGTRLKGIEMMELLKCDTIEAHGVEFNDDGHVRFLRMVSPGTTKPKHWWFEPVETSFSFSFELVVEDKALELEAAYQHSRELAS